MTHQKSRRVITSFLSVLILLIYIFPYDVQASDIRQNISGNFGLPGLIDLPTGRRLPDGELVITQQIHKSLARSGITFQALPRVGFSFRYTGHGINGKEAYGRINHDRSFDAHISLFDEGSFLPAISLGLRDFIGTGWYSSEYIVATKTINKLEVTAGLGYGRLAGRNSFSNPLGILSSALKHRDGVSFGRGGTLSRINWFQGDTSAFYGFKYQVGDKVLISSEYTTDLMSTERLYLDVKSPWNFGASYQVNDYLNLSAQYLYGNEVSLTAQVTVNPGRPPLLGGKELAPVPMRLRGEGELTVKKSYEGVIRKVLTADRFKILKLKIEHDTVSVVVINNKFRSNAQAVGRLASTLQRFTSDDIKFAQISFISRDLQTANYKVDLEKIANQQFNPTISDFNQSTITAFNPKTFQIIDYKDPFSWGVGPYLAHRLFNPDLPLSMEAGIQIEGDYRFAPGLKLSGAIRKSVLTNLTDNKRRSNSVLPHVHSDWPLYDFAGQSGHIHALMLSYTRNLAPGFYGRAHAGLLEPYFAGIGGEILFKPVQSPIGIGIDLHRVRKRNFDMKFDLLDYETTIGHLSVYYDAGEMFEVEVNAGRYLAQDWGITTKISRTFGSGWEVGGYATLTDVPFDTFGEGSFDKAIYVSIPIDWIISSPNRAKRRLTLRPITRDGGANLASARRLYNQIKQSQSASFRREFGRLWK